MLVNGFDGSPSAVEMGVNGLEYAFRRNRGADLDFSFQKSQTMENSWNAMIESVDYEVVSSVIDPADFNKLTLRIRLLNPPPQPGAASSSARPLRSEFRLVAANHFFSLPSGPVTGFSR